MRCLHEASLHTTNSFVTLTFDPAHVPFSVSVSDTQRFMKALRNSFRSPEWAQEPLGSVPVRQDLSPKATSSQAALRRVRFFCCGEYGERGARPHYHFLLFGLRFPDLVLWDSSGPNRTYVSSLLRKVWPYGHSLIGEVNAQTCAYVARYVTKKTSYAQDGVEPDRGGRAPEFVSMSRGGNVKGSHGIGAGWFDKFGREEVYRRDGSSVVFNGVEVGAPRFYDGLLEKSDLVAYERHKSLQAIEAEKLRQHPDSTPERLRVREVVAAARLKTFSPRRFEHGE